jgi:nicotinate-nucleotide--dimethylbenzimidazole phosphoribosyltransferase
MADPRANQASAIDPFVWTIPAIDAGAQAEARRRQGSLTKPAGSLGRLEDLAVQLAGIRGHGSSGVACRPAEAVIFAADHPVVKHGVSAFPSAVTAAMVENFVRGGAAASVLARRLGVGLTVVDVGVATPYARALVGEGARLVRDEVAERPVGDLRVEDAMSRETCALAIAAGARAIDALSADTRVVILGEMGIGNSTVASALAAALLGGELDAMVGAGTGVAGDALARKRAVVRDAVARTGGADPAALLCALGGREIAAIVGAAGRAVERRIAVLVDGFIVSAAILALVRLEPRVLPSLIFAHRSREPGHARILDALDARPLIDLELRLGEASGALTALPLLDLACALHGEMATFADAGVPERAS